MTGLDNLSTGSLKGNLSSARSSGRFDFIHGDVRSTYTPDVDLVFNLACPASPVAYQRDPIATWESSVLGVHNLFKRYQNTKTVLVHTSTSEVYGDPHEHPQKESYWGNVNPIGKRACYDEGKRAAETLLFDARRTLGIDARVVRIFNTYGPRMAVDDGRVVSNFVVAALRGEPLTVYGDGSQTRSLCYVSDLVDGLIRVAFDANTRFGMSWDEPMNLGNPSEISVIELARLVIRVSQSRSEIDFRSLPEDDPRIRCPDISRAISRIGFQPKVSLREGLIRTIRDFLERLG